MKEEIKNVENRYQRTKYFASRIALLILWLFILFLPSINYNFFDNTYSKDEIFYFTITCFLPIFIWIMYLDKWKLELGITEIVLPKRRITIEKTNDVSENIRRYKIAEQVEIARVIEERENSNFIKRFWKRLNI